MATRFTNKQKAFINYYLIYWNASKAARMAGYSKRTASSISYELLRKPHIQAEIEKRLGELQASSEEVKQKLTDHARGNMGDFLDITSMGWQIDLAKAKEKGLLHLLKKVKQHTRTVTHRDGSEEEIHHIEIELYDSQAALNSLGRAHALFTDKQEIITDWRTELVDLISAGDVTADLLIPELGFELVEELFKRAGKPIEVIDQ